MKNMKVATKLIVSFAIVVIMAIIVGIVGIIGMYMISEADKALYNGNYVPTTMADDISQTIVEQRVYLRNFVIYDAVEDAVLFNQAKTNMETSEKNMESLITEYAPTITEDDDRVTFDKLVKTYNSEWKTAKENIYNLGLNNLVEEAQTALIGSSEIAATLDDMSTGLREINMNDGEDTVNSNAQLFTTMAIVSAIVLLLAVLVAVALALYISSLVSKPLLEMKGVMDQIGNTGSLVFDETTTNHLEEIARGKDEIAQSIGASIKMIEHFELLSQILQKVADGDLTPQVTLLSKDDTIGVSLKLMLDNLNMMFSEINTSTVQVSSGSKQIADGAQALAQGSTEQAAAVQELSSSIAEVANKTKENAGMANEAARLADSIKDNAEKGSGQMDQMMAAVREINQASQSISNVISVIDSIAFQTNILALNAAVEAARAGQHGKGFAVVAEEVRNLAAKSSEAAKDTGSLIANSISKAELGAQIAEETAASLVEIVSGINESNQLVGVIARSSEEQSTNINQINRGIEQVAQVVQQNSATAEQSAAASEEMNGQASMLEELISRFKLRDSGASGNFNRRQPVSNSQRPVERLAMPERPAYGSGGDSGFGKY